MAKQPLNNASNYSSIIGENVYASMTYTTNNNIIGWPTLSKIPTIEVKNGFLTQTQIDFSKAGHYKKGETLGTLQSIERDNATNKDWGEVSLNTPINIAGKQYRTLWFSLQSMDYDDGLGVADTEGYNKPVWAANGTTVKFRSSPNTATDKNVIRSFSPTHFIGKTNKTLANGSSYTTSLGAGNKWYMVKDSNGKKGYVAAALVSFEKPEIKKDSVVKKWLGTSKTPNPDTPQYEPTFAETFFKWAIVGVSGLFLFFGIKAIVKRNSKRNK